MAIMRLLLLPLLVAVAAAETKVGNDDGDSGGLMLLPFPEGKKEGKRRKLKLQMTCSEQFRWPPSPPQRSAAAESWRNISPPLIIIRNADAAGGSVSMSTVFPLSGGILELLKLVFKLLDRLI
jgi:hypothetical protein